MRRIWIVSLIMVCLVLTACNAEGNNGLTPSYSQNIPSQSSAETERETLPETTMAVGIELSFGAKDCMEYSLGELVNLFASLGFSDVEIIPCEVTSSAEQKDKILAVLVNGDADFKPSSRYPKDADIRILYAVFTQETNAVETEQEPKTAPETTTETVQESDTTKDETEAVLVYVTESGNKYHQKPNCSDMKNPKTISLAQAEDLEYTPCKRCIVK